MSTPSQTPSFYMLKGLRLAFVAVDKIIERRRDGAINLTRRQQEVHESYLAGLKDALLLIKKVIHDMEKIT